MVPNKSWSDDQILSKGKDKQAPSSLEVNGSIGSASFIISPKTPQDLKNMFHEQIQMEALRLSQEVKQRTQVEPTLSTQKSQEALIKESETDEASGHYYFLKENERMTGQEKHGLNLQQKVDILTEEVFQVLFEELGSGKTKNYLRFIVFEELGKPSKGHLAAKVKGIDEKPVLGMQHLKEHKEFFTHGAEKHHNFQANIPNISSTMIEHGKSSDYHEIAKEELKGIEKIELFERVDAKDVRVDLEQFNPHKDRVIIPTELVQTEEDRKQILDTQSGKNYFFQTKFLCF